MSGEKTELPTEKKKEDSKKKGQVAVSKDVLTLFRLTFIYMLLFSVMVNYFNGFLELIDSTIAAGFSRKFTLNSEISNLAINLFLEIVMPIVAVAVLVGIVGTWAQTGLVIAPEAAMPSFKKLNPIPTIKNMFSKKSLVQLVISVVKSILLAVAIYYVAIFNLQDIVYSYRAGLDVMLTLMWDLLQQAVTIILGLFISLSAIDWIATYFDHLKQMRMSKNEVKDENKEIHGNPEVKRYIKQGHRRLLNASLQRVPNAKVVVTNPTHLAVALDYEPGVHDLPYVLAIGADEDAKLIRELAAKHKIPVVENVRLARMIYSDCDEDEYIQRPHLELAAAVFKLVFSLSKPRN